MARPSLFTHRKFTKLCRMFGTTYTAVGVLEVIWHHAYQDGDPVIGTAEDVEFIVCWDGEPGTCAAALIECGFLEEREDGELAVHDLYDHAPDYVRKRQAREEERRAKSDNDGPRPVSDRSVTRTPAPAPAPVSSNEDTKSARKRAPFVKPLASDVLAYCTLAGIIIDAEAFIDFYESKGWRVGNQPMKDWQAAVRGWHRREKERKGDAKVRSAMKKLDPGSAEYWAHQPPLEE